MTVSLTPKAEQLLKEELTRGQYAGAEEVVERALLALREDAVTRFRRLRQGVRLADLRSRAAMHEGHRY